MILLVARRQSKREGAMFRVLVVCYVIGFVSCQIRLNSTISDNEINGTTVRVSELVMTSDIAVHEVELATASTQNVSLNPASTEDLVLNARVSKLVTTSDTAVREVELATASTQSVSLDPISTEDFVLNDRQCPSGSSKPCVVKCCPLGESIASSLACEPTTLKFRVIFFGEKGGSNATAADDGDYDYIFGNPCLYERYRLEPHDDSNDEFHVLRSGFLRAPYLFPDLLTPDDYCLEVFQDPNTKEGEVLPLVCFPEIPINNSPRPLQYILYPIGLLISVPFLIVTMLAYLMISELRDLHGKTLVCHVLCLTVAYLFLAAVQLGGETLNQQLCVGVAFVIQFSFLACFFWLNVLSFNTWWSVVANIRLQIYSTRSSRNCYRGYVISEKNEVTMPKGLERKAFVVFSVYAWCCPLVLVLASMIFDLMPIIPSSYLKPNFGDNKCWFSSEDAELPYFYGPVAVIICINIVLFISTACKIFCHGRAPRAKPREIFRMCFCLFCVMGINWMMEIVSWFLGGPDYIWYVTDVINTLQGVIIFLIFILEPRVRSCVWGQWGPKLTQILCRSQDRHASVIYRTPEDAVIQINK